MALVSAKTAAAILPAMPALLMIGAIACRSFGSDDASSRGDGGDAGAQAEGREADANDTPEGDAGCTVLVADSFDDPAASAARWRFLGAARVIDGELELVPDVAGQTGAIWMNLGDAGAGAGAGTGRLVARFTSKIAPANGSDGLTFAWSANQDVNLGGTGGNYGLCNGGAEGLAVVLASFSRAINVLDVSDDCTKDAGVATNVFGTNGIELSARADRVDVSIADKPFVFPVTRSVRVRSIGFTAATGGGHARHAIDDVHVEVCPP
jgi:hypothetical protein